MGGTPGPALPLSLLRVCDIFQGFAIEGCAQWQGICNQVGDQVNSAEEDAVVVTGSRIHQSDGNIVDFFSDLIAVLRKYQRTTMSE